MKGIKRFLKEREKSLGEISKWYYAIMYILCIFIFAIIYTLLPNNFYHATVQYENSLNYNADDILKAIQNNIIDSQKNYDDGKIFVNKKVSIDGSKLSVNSLKFEDNNDVSFIVNVVINDDTSEGRIESIENRKFNISLINKVGNFDVNNNMIYYLTLTPQDTREFNMDDFKNMDIYKALFPSKYINGLYSPKLIMTMKSKVLEQILNLQNAKNGFPSGVNYNFGRMFYLSAITITTVGYGDIVPITTVARNLISFEAILGVILIGLFLNSLSLSKSNSISKTEKEKIVIQNRIGEIEKLLRYDKVMQIHINEYLIYTKIITTPVDKRYSSEWSKDFKFIDMCDLFKSSLLLKDNHFEPAINFYFKRQKELIQVVEKLVFNIELSYWNDLENSCLKILKNSNEFDFSNYILNQPNTRLGNKTGAEFDSKMIKDHTGKVEFLQSNLINPYVALYYQIKSYIDFVESYNNIINNIKENLIQLKDI